MCGIAGIIGRIAPENRSALERMNAALSHRGPDGDGFWESTPSASGFGVMLAHRRLSILDLSNAAAQPMVDPVTGDVITYNGEVYNFVDLRRQLEAEGHTLASSGDTAAMLRALSMRGADSVEELRGMFAFGFWDESERTLTIARDQLGIKPLYVSANPDPNGEWRIAFASEVRALLASGLLQSRRLNPAAVASMIWNGFTVAPMTAVEGIETLHPGELRRYSDRGVEQHRKRYWRIPGTEPPHSSTEESLEAALQESIRLHLASDVPLGVFLSGGVDSSVIANLAHRASQKPVHTFTLAFEEAKHNEGVFARRIADAIGTQHQEVMLTEGYFVSGLEGALDSLDQPTFDGLNSYFMSRAVRDAGFKVALVGTGGDELFGGYTSFRDLPAMLDWSRRTGFVPTGIKAALGSMIARYKGGGHRAGDFPAQTRWAKLPAMLERGGDLIGLYQLAYALFLPDSQRDLVSQAVADVQAIDGLPPTMRDDLRGEIGTRSPLSAISVLEERLFLGERLLRDTDAASMAASIEIRLPLVDHVLWQHVDRLPPSRYEPLRSKAMLRRVGLRGLDPALFDRPKSGFELPFERWLKNALGKRIDETLRDSQAVASVGLNPKAVQSLWDTFQRGGAGLYWTRIWAIYALIHWCRRHSVAL